MTRVYLSLGSNLGNRLEKVFQIINENTRQPAENPANKAVREGRVVGLANHTLLITKDGQERPVEDEGGNSPKAAHRSSTRQPASVKRSRDNTRARA